MSNKHVFIDEDEEDSLIINENEQEQDDELVLDLSVKNRVSSNENLNQLNKRKNKPTKSTALLIHTGEIEDEQVEAETNEGSEDILAETTDYENQELNNNSINDDDYLSNNQDELTEHYQTEDEQQHNLNQSEISINDSSDIINEDENLNESFLLKNQNKISKNNNKIQTSKFKTVNTSVQDQNLKSPTTNTTQGKKQMRFQCRFCIYKSHSVSLMQNHIYRHIDTTPYSCFYCGHKSTTKSTIMVHIELCHPNMEVKIKESRVKEEDYYLDLNSTSNTNSGFTQEKIDSISKTSKPAPIKRKKQDVEDEDKNQLNSILSFKSSNSTSPSLSSSSESSLCSSPSQSPNPHKTEQLQFIKTVNEEDVLLQNNPDDDFNKDSNNSYVTVFNRPKQYFGSLYEPDKQYSCKLCTYTTNHKPSMEDHVYVHTNKRPYRCGYCNEEIYTRYAATYHNKYKHPGEPRNFIKDEQDVSIYYVNRAKKNSSSSSSGLSVSFNHSNNTEEELNSSSSVKINKTVENNNDSSKSIKKLKKNQESEIKQSSSSSNKTGLNNTSSNPFSSNINQLISTAPNNNSSSNNKNNSSNGMNNSNNTSVPNYDINIALKMYQIQLQSLMAANYLQTIRSGTNTNLNPIQTSNQPANLLASYFGLNQDQLQQLSSYLSLKNKFENDETSLINNQTEKDLSEKSLLNSENSDKIETINNNKNSKLIKNK